MDCWNGVPYSSNSILLHDVCSSVLFTLSFCQNGPWQQKIILCSVWKMPSLRRIVVPVCFGYFLLLMRALRFGACNATMQLIHMRWFRMYCVCKSHRARERKIPHCCGYRTRVFSIVNRPICRKMPSHSMRHSSRRVFLLFISCMHFSSLKLILIPCCCRCFNPVFSAFGFIFRCWGFGRKKHPLSSCCTPTARRVHFKLFINSKIRCEFGSERQTADTKW